MVVPVLMNNCHVAHTKRPSQARPSHNDKCRERKSRWCPEHERGFASDVAEIERRGGGHNYLHGVMKTLMQPCSLARKRV